MTLNLIAWINRTGYGYHSVNVVHAAPRVGIEVALWPCGSVDASEGHTGAITRAIENQMNFNFDMPSVNISPAAFLAFHVGKGKRVGWPGFESTRFNAHETHQLRSQDLLIVASHWAKEVINTIVPDVPSRVVPQGVDSDIFHPNVPRLKSSINPNIVNGTVFMNVGKWEERKGQRFLLSAFNKAFDKNDNAWLILACHNLFSQEINEQWERECRECKLAKNVIAWNTRYETQDDLASLMAIADCGVFPARAEGWNLELLEMMSMGKAVIATDYSGHTEYATSANCRLVSIDNLETANDGIWFHGDGEWAALGNAQEEQLISYMREVHALKREGADLSNMGGIKTARSYSWEATVQRLVGAIREDS